MSLPKEMIKRNFDLAIKTVSKVVGNEGLKIPKAGISIWGPKILKQIGIEGGVPLSGIIVNSLFKIITNDYGHIYTSDELLEVKKFLKSLKTLNNIELLTKSGQVLSDLKNQNISKVNKPDLIKILSSRLKNKEIPQDVLDMVNKEVLKTNIERIKNEK